MGAAVPDRIRGMRAPMRTASLSRRVFGHGLALVGLARPCGGGGCETKTDDIAVSAYLSLSGSESTFGIDTKDGFELAMNEVNADGGVKGKKLRVIYED